MLIEEYPYIDEDGNERNDLVKHCSDNNLYVLQNETGIKYEVAIDMYPCRYTYIETDEHIPIEQEAKNDWKN